MNDKPKSIWKKSWTGWGWLWAWLILAVATFFIVLIIGLLTPGGARNLRDAMGDAMGIATFVSVVAVLFVGVLAFIHCLCSWINFRRFLFACACLITLIALAYAEEDWRGWHAWNKFKHEWEAKGEKFDFASVVPPPVPDDQNFALTPVWIAEIKFNFRDNPKRAEAWYGDRIYSPEVSNLVSQLPVTVSGLVGADWWHNSPNMPKESGNWATARITDLKPWQTYYRDLGKTNLAAHIPVAAQPQSPAADVLLALSKYDPVIEKLWRDSALPFSRFPVKYDTDPPAEILIPHLAAVKRYAQVLQLRAIAELQNGQSEKALDHVKLSLRLADSIRAEPFLISHLVRIAILQITLQPVYEGLVEFKWSDEQLVALDSELAKLDLLADYKLSMRGEMGLHDGNIDYLIRNRRELFNMTSGTGASSGPPFISSLIPTGWFYQNRLGCARMVVEYYIPVADVNQQTVSPSAIRHADDVLFAETKKTTLENFLEKILLSTQGNAVKHFAYAQSSVALARVAIALERYRLAHGEYPESLDALSPQFIAKVPHDIINGQPLKFRRTSDGQFVLYSVGWNERDDGGVVAFWKGSTRAVNRDEEGPMRPVNRDEGDWVWRYPTK